MIIQSAEQHVQAGSKEKNTALLEKTGLLFIAFLLGFLSFKGFRTVNDIVFVLLISLFVAKTIITYRKYSIAHIFSTNNTIIFAHNFSFHISTNWEICFNNVLEVFLVWNILLEIHLLLFHLL